MIKRIGIVGWSTGDKSFGISKPYLNYFSQFGLVQILGPSEMIDENIDLLVLPGGKDINPARYNQQPSVYNTDQNPSLEFFDTNTLQKYIDASVPVFSICRGLQTINILFGGTLIQHLISHPKSNDRNQLVHKLYSSSDILNENKNYLFEVNSIHHQCIDKLGDGLSIELYSEDGIVEAIKHTKFPIYGVQWHPEEIDDDYSRKIIENLLNF
jgi:putative glutamine amidotransferase